MATLTTTWTTYATASFSTGSATIKFSLQARYTSQSIANNTTAVQTRLRSDFTKGSSINGAGYKFTCTYCNTVSGTGVWYFSDEVITSGGATVTHNSDGTKTITLKATAHNDYWNFTKSFSASVTLPTIPRSATITSAPNFTDLDNPKITYSNPAGNSVTTLQASIYLTDSTTGLAYYRDISKTGTSYTFNLTEDERNRLRSNCTNAKSRTVRFYVRTILGGVTYTSILERTLTITDANPTFDATYEDTNASSIAITGDNQLLIQNQSTLQINVANATAYKYATLSSIAATINGVTYNGTLNGSNGTINVGALNIAENTDAIVTLTDSRGYTKTQTLNLQFLGWQLPTANITLQRQNNFYSQTDITVDANYSSLDGQNTISIYAMYKKTTDSTYSTAVILQDNVTTTLNLDNLYEWDVQVVLTDRLGTTTYNLTVGKGMPIIYFDRLKRSVGINCFPNDDESLEVIEGNNQLNVGKKIETNIMTAYFTSNYTLAANSTYYKLPINSNKAVGTKLTLDTTNHNIVIGSGVSQVKVSAKVCFNSIAASGDKWLTVYKNNESISANPRNLSGRDMIYATTFLVNVQENDTIYFSVYGTRNDVIRADIAYSNLTVEVAE